MYTPKGLVVVDLQKMQLANMVETGASLLRQDGKEDEAVALFRLRAKIREGVSFVDASPIFDKHTKKLRLRKSDKHLT